MNQIGIFYISIEGWLDILISKKLKHKININKESVNYTLSPVVNSSNTIQKQDSHFFNFPSQFLLGAIICCG